MRNCLSNNCIGKDFPCVWECAGKGLTTLVCWFLLFTGESSIVDPECIWFYQSLKLFQLKIKISAEYLSYMLYAIMFSNIRHFSVVFGVHLMNCVVTLCNCWDCKVLIQQTHVWPASFLCRDLRRKACHLPKILCDRDHGSLRSCENAGSILALYVTILQMQYSEDINI